MNQPTGDSVKDTYPSGGTQEKRNVSCRRLWVSMFTTSPSQKTGIEIPISPITITATSSVVPRKTAAISPSPMANVIQRTEAPSTRLNVTGAASTTCGMTFAPRFTNDVRSREMKSRFIISAYWTGMGLSSPKSLLTSRSVCWSAFRPAMRAAGSTPGVAKKIRKTRTLIENMTSNADAARRTTKRSIRALS